MKLKIVIYIGIISMLCCMTGCKAKKESTKTLENDSSFDSLTDTVDEDLEKNEEYIVPSYEEVLKMREMALDGMEKEDIDRLCENIKVANQTMENGYLYDDLFEKLEDENNLYWNYFDKKGDIQVGWSYDGDYKEIRQIRESEDLTLDEFYQKYGKEVYAYNRFDADNFVALIEDMKKSVMNENLQNDLQYIADETKLAKETHQVEHAENIYKALHDMDYFLLRYGIKDVGEYVKDVSTIAKYYGVLSIYEE